MFTTELMSIPVYAISPKELMKRYVRLKQSLEQKLYSLPEDNARKVIEYMTFPQCSTLLNHVIGYIVVSLFGNALYFDVFLPAKLTRYKWNSRKRHFIQNITANCFHFETFICKDNREIQEKAWEMMKTVIKNNVPSRFFVDMQNLYRINICIDYEKLIYMAKNKRTEKLV